MSYETLDAEVENEQMGCPSCAVSDSDIKGRGDEGCRRGADAEKDAPPALPDTCKQMQYQPDHNQHSAHGSLDNGDDAFQNAAYTDYLTNYFAYTAYLTNHYQCYDHVMNVYFAYYADVIQQSPRTHGISRSTILRSRALLVEEKRES